MKKVNKLIKETEMVTEVLKIQEVTVSQDLKIRAPNTAQRASRMRTVTEYWISEVLAGDPWGLGKKRCWRPSQISEAQAVMMNWKLINEIVTKGVRKSRKLFQRKLFMVDNNMEDNDRLKMLQRERVCCLL